MTGISLAGLIGAVVGTIVAAVSYYVFIGILDRIELSQKLEERDSYDRNMSIVRRLVLTVDLVVFAGAGYWLGRTLFE